jgi:broad specificity phosphatase PhoE
MRAPIRNDAGCAGAERAPISARARLRRDALLPALSPMPAPVLYFIRHGETDWNVEGRLQGHRDVPLNASGREQATACGPILRKLVAREGRSLDSLDYVSSPLGRARQTMEIMRRHIDLAPTPYSVDERLAELSFGAWEGLTLSEIRDRDPALFAERERDKWRFVPPGGESYEQLAARMKTWYEDLRRDAVVVAHGGTARALLATLAIAAPHSAPNVPIDQGVVYRFAEGSMARYREHHVVSTPEI